MKCKIFSRSEAGILEAEIIEWMDEKGQRLRIRHIKQSESAYSSVPSMPSFYRITISIWYDMQALP